MKHNTKMEEYKVWFKIARNMIVLSLFLTAVLWVCLGYSAAETVQMLGLELVGLLGLFGLITWLVALTEHVDIRAFYERHRNVFSMIRGVILVFVSAVWFILGCYWFTHGDADAALWSCAIGMIVSGNVITFLFYFK